MPQEIEVWYLIPAIRKEFVKLMIKKGLSQKKAANKLGITEAAVSQYLKDKRACDVKFNEQIKKEMEKSVENILKNGCLIKEMNIICELCKKNMILCEIHKKHGHVSGKCKICLK